MEPNSPNNYSILAHARASKPFNTIYSAGSTHRCLDLRGAAFSARECKGATFIGCLLDGCVFPAHVVKDSTFHNCLIINPRQWPTGVKPNHPGCSHDALLFATLKKIEHADNDFVYNPVLRHFFGTSELPDEVA